MYRGPGSPSLPSPQPSPCNRGRVESNLGECRSAERGGWERQLRPCLRCPRVVVGHHHLSGKARTPSSGGALTDYSCECIMVGFFVVVILGEAPSSRSPNNQFHFALGSVEPCHRNGGIVGASARAPPWVWGASAWLCRGREYSIRWIG
jgi:hypothetical protein